MVDVASEREGDRKREGKRERETRSGVTTGSLPVMDEGTSNQSEWKWGQ